MTDKAYKTLAATLVAAWFIFSVTGSALGWFKTNDARFGVPVAIAALTPILLFLAWFAVSPGFRRFTASLNAGILTLIQTWRIGGFVFIVLTTMGLLPAIFAWPAGLGDMAIGATAPLIAARFATPEHRKRFITWQALGMLDLVMAVSLGTTARLITPSGAGMYPMTVLPLSLVPTFIVPLLMMFHVIAIAQARQWNKAQKPSHPRIEFQSSLA